MGISDYINYSDQVDKYCRPLFNYIPISRFSYVELKRNGQFIHLTSDKVVYDEVIKVGLDEKCAAEAFSMFNQPGFHINDYLKFNNGLEEVQKKYSDFMSNFDYGHAMFIIDHDTYGDEAKFRMYVYESRLKFKNVNHDYLNNLDVLKNFNRYFQQQLTQELPTLSYSKTAETCLQTVENIFDSCAAKQKVLVEKNVTFNRALNSLVQKKLTSRETEIMYWYLMGKTSYETGVILGISARTVENTFERVKVKLDCPSKNHLLLQYRDLI
jgi:DNA-binding CsgD family transcriptional regulator